MHLLRGQSRSGGDHRQRLEAFYGPQADHYDDFRDRLLHGREALVQGLCSALGESLRGAKVVELGGGTGRNLEFFGEGLADFSRVDIVDLCPSLLDKARSRFADHPRVRVIEADATHFRPPEPVDLIYCAYSLTMIPDWRATIDNALASLKPGGFFGAVDFYVSTEQPPAHLARHHFIERWFWPRWFAHDGVHLNPAHLEYLRSRFPDHELSEHRGKLPYLPAISVPYYVFLGKR